MQVDHSVIFDSFYPAAAAKYEVHQHRVIAFAPPTDGQEQEKTKHTSQSIRAL